MSAVPTDLMSGLFLPAALHKTAFFDRLGKARPQPGAGLAFAKKAALF